LQRLAHLLLAGIADEVVRHLEAAHAVGDHGDLEAADLVAVPARRLRAGRRRGGVSREARGERGKDGGCGGTGEQATSCELGHGVSPVVCAAFADRLFLGRGGRRAI